MSKWLTNHYQHLGKKNEPRKYLDSQGADGQTRTDDRRFTKPLLYHWATSANNISFFCQATSTWKYCNIDSQYFPVLYSNNYNPFMFAWFIDSGCASSVYLNSTQARLTPGLSTFRNFIYFVNLGISQCYRKWVKRAAKLPKSDWAQISIVALEKWEEPPEDIKRGNKW